MDDQKKEINTRFQNIEMTLKQVQEKQTATNTIISNLQPKFSIGCHLNPSKTQRKM